MTARPNIVFTIADDQRFDLLSAWGRNECQTPHLDRLIERGTWYRRAQTMGSTHAAVCAPSRAMLHTGWSLYRIPDEIRTNWAPAPWPVAPATDAEHVPLLGEQLRRAGYHCHGIGKWHNGSRAFARSFDSGANIFFGGMADQFTTPVQEFDPAGRYANDRCRSSGRHSTELFIDSALDFIRGRGRRDAQPFFLYCAFTVPHDPRQTLPEWHARYPVDQIRVPENFLPQHPFDNGELKIRDELLAGFPRTGCEIRQHLADYYALTTHMDDALGRLYHAVEQAGVVDNTIFVHTADHGLAVGQHGLMGKQNLYDHSVRVPLIVAGPGFDRGKPDDRLCYLHDLFPTLLNVASAKVPDSCEFPDLRSARHRETLFGAYRDCQRLAGDDRWKLIEYFVDGTRRTQLFDRQSDPWELRDRFADPDCASIVTRLRAALQQWRQDVGDPLTVAL